MVLKRYALFCCNRYYSGGGFNDFVGAFDDVDAARAVGTAWEPLCGYGSWHVVDLTTGQKVAEGEYDIT